MIGDKLWDSGHDLCGEADQPSFTEIHLPGGVDHRAIASSAAEEGPRVAAGRGCCYYHLMHASEVT